MPDRCDCTPCSFCNGSGVTWFAVGGQYLGNRRCDDLDTMETCEECGGSGVEMKCGPCMDWQADRDDERDAEVETDDA